MKRFWLVLLSLGLVMAFSVSAWAVDVKFSGSFYAAGMYLDKTDLAKPTGAGTQNNPSTAFYYQRLRLQTDFIVSPGLKLVTRFDAMERVWGAARTATTATDSYGSIGGVATSAGTTAENENIAFDWAYIEYASPIGLFAVGYQADNIWGTIFNDNGRNGYSCGKIGWMIPIGPAIVGLGIYKEGELSKTAKYSTTLVDNDSDKYVAFGIYNFKGGSVAGEVGLIYTFSRVATYKQSYPYTAPYGTMIYVNTLQPYTKLKFGPVAIEAEFDYYWGKKGPALAGASAEAEDGYAGHDTKMENFGLYIDALADFGIAYVGGTFAYISGDDPSTTDKLEGGTNSGGIDWNPCLIMWNFDRTYWAGSLGAGAASGTTNSAMSNAFFYQVRGGVRPIAALDLGLSVSYAYADQKPSIAWVNKTYGWEVDVTGTYKITNNLSYMLGVGYFLTGDYFKGTSSTAEVRDDYLIINKLTLTF